MRALIDGQARADRDAGLDWTRSPRPPERSTHALRRAHARLPIDLDDPRVWASRDDQRRALAARLGVAGEQADDLSRWALDAARRVRRRRPALLADRLRARGWRSPTSSSAGRARRAARRRVRRARRGPRAAGSSCPVLSLDAIRLLAALGGTRRPRPARRHAARRRGRRAARARQPAHACTPGRTSASTRRRSSPQALARELGTTGQPGRAARQARPLGPAARDAGAATRGPRRAAARELALRVVTFPAREFPRRRLGAAPLRRAPRRSRAR